MDENVFAVVLFVSIALMLAADLGWLGKRAQQFIDELRNWWSY